MFEVQMGYLAAAGDDGTILEVVGGNDPEAPPGAWSDCVATFGFRGLHHVCFTVPSVDRTVENLKSRNVKVVAEPFSVEAIARRIADFADPWGNLFELEEILT
jgi:predicted enzyme related to lactoylglutathione lyase